MSKLIQLENSANKSDINEDGGELFITLHGENTVSIKDLKDLKGWEIETPYFDMELLKVLNVETALYRNVDGLFLCLEVQAEFLFSYPEGGKEQQNVSFSIWIPDEDGEEIDSGNFSNSYVSYDPPIEVEKLDKVLAKFDL